MCHGFQIAYFNIQQLSIVLMIMSCIEKKTRFVFGSTLHSALNMSCNKV